MIHFHAYAWNGSERPDSLQEHDLSATYPPAEVKYWLKKPRSMLKGTFTEIADAVGWLAKEFAETPFPDGYGRTDEQRLEFTAEQLGFGNDAIWGWYPAGRRYVQRNLICCPRDGRHGGEIPPCPQPPA